MNVSLVYVEKAFVTSWGLSQLQSHSQCLYCTPVQMDHLAPEIHCRADTKLPQTGSITQYFFVFIGGSLVLLLSADTKHFSSVLQFR